MSLVTKDKCNKSTIYNSARKQIQLMSHQSLPHCILLIYGYIRQYLENGLKEITIPKPIIKFILKGLNTLKSSNELKPFFMTPIEKLPGLMKSGNISLMKVIEQVIMDNNINNIATDNETKENELIPFDEAKQQRDKLVSTIAKILAKTCHLNNQFSVANNVPFITFDASVSIHDYLERFNVYSHCSNEIFVMALIYIDRLIKRGIVVNRYTIHKVLLIAIVTAIKFQDDIYYDNKAYAGLGSVTVQELNELEVCFLGLLSFELFIQQDEYQSYLECVTHFS
eukprot:441322_1